MVVARSVIVVLVGDVNGTVAKSRAAVTVDGRVSGSELLPLLASSMHIRVVLSKVLQIILSH